MHLWTSLGLWFVLKLSNIVHHLKKLSHIPWFKEKHYPINNNNWATWLFLILSDTICLYSVRRKRSIRPSCPAAYLSSLTQSQPACSRHATVSLNMLSPVTQLCMASSTPRERSESPLTARPVSTLLRSHGDFRLGHGVIACSTSILTSPAHCDCILSCFSYTLTFTECHLLYVLITWWYEKSSRYFI